MTGGLRKRRGTELDLSDSDDDEEARRRMKRRKEMKLRKALLADEHIEKIGELAETGRLLDFIWLGSMADEGCMNSHSYESQEVRLLPVNRRPRQGRHP